MTEHPILFNSDMVRAIMNGRKTQTIRPIRPQPTGPIMPVISCKRQGDRWLEQVAFGPENRDRRGWPKYWTNPFGNTGDLLWVRETFAELWGFGGGAFYRANYLTGSPTTAPWTPSIHMPRRLARIFLEVVETGFQHLQEITPAQISAECVDRDFPTYWDSIYGAGEFAWHRNPLVWWCWFKQINDQERK